MYAVCRQNVVIWCMTVYWCAMGYVIHWRAVLTRKEVTHKLKNLPSHCRNWRLLLSSQQPTAGACHEPTDYRAHHYIRLSIIQLHIALQITIVSLPSVQHFMSASFVPLKCPYMVLAQKFVIPNATELLNLLLILHNLWKNFFVCGTQIQCSGYGG